MDVQTELHQRLSEIGSHVDLAAMVGYSAPGASDALHAALRRLRELAQQAKQLYMTSGRESDLTACLAALEAAAEQACSLCRAQADPHEFPAATLDEALQEIRELRHQVESGAR
jgi:hypothetical protein